MSGERKKEGEDEGCGVKRKVRRDEKDVRMVAKVMKVWKWWQMKGGGEKQTEE
jgi:hypothetical protein